MEVMELTALVDCCFVAYAACDLSARPKAEHPPEAFPLQLSTCLIYHSSL
jgi:hypothetical protein